MEIRMELGKDSYPILIERGILNSTPLPVDLNRKVMIVTDDGVPDRYAKTVQSACKNGFLHTVTQGEESKSIAELENILKHMLREGFTRKDAVIAVGGGVVGDLAGFAASCYMRGVDFYNVPTTLLSQVDSSIGGKTAVNLESVKNIVGAFYQPKKVIIDPDTLSTLSDRQFSAGLAESIKMALIYDSSLFDLLEKEPAKENIESIIASSLRIKKDIVEKDEKESDLRRALNFGHTIGHGIESVSRLYHGECVAIGMIPMCSEKVRKRLIAVLKKYSLPLTVKADPEKVYKAMLHDKKADGGKNRDGIRGRCRKFYISNS